MTTVLEECPAEEQLSVVPFSVDKKLNAKDIYKEMFPAYGGKCLWSKAVHSWEKKRSKFSLMTKGLKRRCGSGYCRL
jgi:hypothetical protein